MSGSQESSRPPAPRRQQAVQGSHQPAPTSQGSGGPPPTPAMLRARNRINQKFRAAATSTSRGRGKSRRTESIGKNYSSQTEREVVERRDPEKVVQRNKECDTKKGGRNSKTGYSLRNLSRLGSDVFKPPRTDRIYSADASGEPYSQFVADNQQ